MPGALTVPLLVLVEHLNLHWLSGQHSAGGWGKGHAGVAGKGVRRRTPWCWMQTTLCKMRGWMKHKLESRLPGEISTTSYIQMIPLYGRKQERNYKASHWRWKSRVKKLAYYSGLKTHALKGHGIQSHHFMANRWGKNGNSDRLYFLGLQNHCRWVTAAMK